MDPLGERDRTVTGDVDPGVYRALFRSCSDGLVLLEGGGGRILEANAAAAILFRQPGESLAGRHFVDLIDSRDIARFDEAARSALSGGSARLDLSIERPGGGHPRPVSVYLEAVGESGLLIILHDITEKSRLLDMVRREKETTRSLLETVNVSVLSTDLKGRIIVMNRRFREISGLELSTVLGADAFEVIVVDGDRPRAREAHASVVSTGVVEELDLRCHCRGADRVMSFNGALVRDAEGRPVGVVWVAVDVTTARRLMEDVRRREERTQRSLQQLKEFSRVSGLILQERDLDQVCRMFVEAIRDVSNFNRAILTLCDEGFRGYQWYFAGLSEKEIATFHENKLTSRERVTIFQERFRLGNSYYIPHDEDWHYEGVRSSRPSDDMVDWHPDDFLFIPLFGSNRKIVGIVSVDDPADGRRPSAESISPLELFANQVAHAIEAKKLDQEVKKTNERYRTLVETMNNGLFSVDLGERITFVNPAMLELTGYTEGELAGRPLSEVMSDAHIAEFRNRTRVRDAGHSRFEAELIDAKGEQIPVLISATPYLLNNQKRGAFAIVSDLREQRAAEQERQRMHEEAVAANIKLTESMQKLQAAQEQLVQAEKLSALGELISGVAHELNNPLTGVMGFAQILMNTETSDEIRRTVTRINSEAVRCQKIVQNLLAFARRHRPQRTLVDINLTLANTVDLRSYQLKVDDIGIDLDLQDGLPPVMADAHQLQQVFINILNNAHHALQGTGRPGRLRVSTRDRGEAIRITFSDDGPGIPPDRIGRIFDPFYTTKPIGKGTGLGLSLSYGIIKEHDGEIRAESIPGEGATFIIDLPARRDAEAVVEERREPAAEPPAAPGTILIVDDEESIVDLLVTILEASGHTVATAGNGREALDLVRDHDYDLIISDLKMPDMGGQRLYEEIRTIKPHLTERMIFSTGDTVNPSTQEFFRQTGNPHLAKPFSLDDVDAVVRRALRSVDQDPDSKARA